MERSRKQSFTVETVEQETHFEAPGLRLRLRVDRIDRLENGNVLLIDYKSGQQSRNKLKGARPKEPQLLVYAASSADPVDGIFFAEMKPNEVRAVGVSREKQFESRSIDVKKTRVGFISGGIASGSIPAGRSICEWLRGGRSASRCMQLLREQAALPGERDRWPARGRRMLSGS